MPPASGITMPYPSENRLYAKQAARRAAMNDVTPSRPPRRMLARNSDSHILGIRRSSDSTNEDESPSGSLQSRSVSSIWSSTPIRTNKAATHMRQGSRDSIPKSALGIEPGDPSDNAAHRFPRDHHSRRNTLIMPSPSSSVSGGNHTGFPIWRSPGHAPAASMDDTRQSQNFSGCSRWLFGTPPVNRSEESKQQALPNSF
ncbi:hypothetical protein VTN31DRAFT_5755 [Thermomyces dupontii]|uniref:uncharacterized protein n=1 Tax=Talaromyces thermophilus TaxID=28565 RepID=UPI0037435ADD